MVHSPDDISLCSIGHQFGGVCIRNYLYYNSLWEWVNYMTADRPDRIGMNLNTFRSRYADTVSICVLPGIVVVQILLMGSVSTRQAIRAAHALGVQVPEWTHADSLPRANFVPPHL